MEERVTYAGFWIRAIALLLDGVIIGIILNIIAALFFEGVAREAAYYFLFMIVTIAFWITWEGRTPGKKLMKIKIVSYPDLQPIGLGKAILRYVVGYFVSSIVFGLGFIIAGLRQDKRALHDLIAGTCVVKEDSR